MYKIFKNAFKFSPKLENYIREKSNYGDPIFNNINNDEKRIQFSFKNPFKREIKSYLQQLIEDLGYTGNINDPVILKSHPYCKRQRLHYDYDIGLLENVDKDYPHGVIIGVSNNCRLIVSPDGISRKYIHFNKGDVVIFRGDTIHAGSEYYTENIRIHAYIDSPSHLRIKNQTFVVS